MDKDKTIRVSDEVLEMVTGHKDKNASLSATISVLLDKYEPTDFISKKKGKFVLLLNFAEIEIPTFTPVNKIIRISPEVYDRLHNIKAYPDESFNMILYRLVTSVTTKPYILQLGKMHSAMLENYKKYCFHAGVDIDLGEQMYELPDVINVIQTDAKESSLISRFTGEILRVWSKPFSDQYEYRPFVDKLFCPDQMAYETYLFIAEFEDKIGKDFTWDIVISKLRKCKN